MPISHTINRIHAKLILKEHNKPLERIPFKYKNSSISVMAIDKKIRNLMLATTKSRTVVNYSTRHYCQTHKQVIDENHLPNCSHLNRFGSPMKFVPIIRNTKLAHCSDKFCNNVIDYYKWLHKTIDTLIQEGKWTLDQDFKKIRRRKANQLGESEDKDKVLQMVLE